MKGKFSRQQFLSSVARISARLRTSTQSPTRKFSTPFGIELDVFMLTHLPRVDIHDSRPSCSRPASNNIGKCISVLLFSDRRLSKPKKSTTERATGVF